MEGEINNFIMVWIVALTSLCYCHTIGIFIPKGISRLLFILPVVCIFFLLPLNLTSIHLCSLIVFFISCLANGRILLFAFGKGPLSSKNESTNQPKDVSIPLTLFIPLACLPIKICHVPSNQNSKFDQKQTSNSKEIVENKKRTHNHDKSPLNYAIKFGLLVLIVNVYSFKEHLHPKVMLFIHANYMYLALELILAMFAALARALARLDLEPQFNEPYLSTSLQNFWGRRWNLLVTSILRQTAYEPVRSASARMISARWASLPAVMATFFVSGLMHELFFYYMGRNKPTWEVTWFFIIHGFCSVLEIGMKKMAKGKFRLPAYVSGPLTVFFVIGTSLWLFFPPLLRCKPDLKGCTEMIALIEFVKNRRLISPNDLSCPFF